MRIAEFVTEEDTDIVVSLTYLLPVSVANFGSVFSFALFTV